MKWTVTPNTTLVHTLVSEIFCWQGNKQEWKYNLLFLQNLFKYHCLPYDVENKNAAFALIVGPEMMSLYISDDICSSCHAIHYFMYCLCPCRNIAWKLGGDLLEWEGRFWLSTKQHAKMGICACSFGRFSVLAFLYLWRSLLYKWSLNYYLLWSVWLFSVLEKNGAERRKILSDFCPKQRHKDFVLRELNAGGTTEKYRPFFNFFSYKLCVVLSHLVISACSPYWNDLYKGYVKHSWSPKILSDTRLNVL